jgi:hypothetical protein
MFGSLELQYKGERKEEGPETEDEGGHGLCAKEVRSAIAGGVSGVMADHHQGQPPQQTTTAIFSFNVFTLKLHYFNDHHLRNITHPEHGIHFDFDYLDFLSKRQPNYKPHHARRKRPREPGSRSPNDRCRKALEPGNETAKPEDSRKQRNDDTF